MEPRPTLKLTPAQLKRIRQLDRWFVDLMLLARQWNSNISLR